MDQLALGGEQEEVGVEPRVEEDVQCPGDHDGEKNQESSLGIGQSGVCWVISKGPPTGPW